jgi:hypothetical protein
MQPHRTPTPRDVNRRSFLRTGALPLRRSGLTPGLRRWLILGLGVAFVLNACAAPAERLLWHEVRLDAEGKLLSWVKDDAPYDRVIRNAWAAFTSIPVQPDGYRTYFTYPTFYGPNDPSHPVFSGRGWVHHPTGLFAMLTDSAILYHAYTGDRSVLERVREMLDHLIAQGSTDITDAWSRVPYSCADAGSLTYRGANDTLYCFQENHEPCGRGDGVGFLEPDKVGEIGHAFLRFHEVRGERKYLEAAFRCADALARHVRPGDESHSPWPFRVDARTGTRIREEYTANTIGPIRLFDELLRLELGDCKAYRQARDLAWRWLMTYPVQNQVWTQYFEDVLIYPDHRTNLNQYSPLETARYLLEHPDLDPQARAHAKRILDWVTARFAADSVTMAGLPEKGRQWGAEVISEQVNDMDKMSSHTARYASVRALWFEVTGDLDSRERAFRSFNWATYSSQENGLVKTSLDEGTGYWFSDGYGDYMRHFQRGIASVPDWGPENEDHLLGSSSVVRTIHYGEDEIVYATFDKSSREVLRLRRAPDTVWAGSSRLAQVRDLRRSRQGYSVEPAAGGGAVVRVQHQRSGDIRVSWRSAERLQPDPGPEARASSVQPGFEAPGAVDKDRFAPGLGHAWKGGPDLGSWQWEIDFGAPRRVGALLQVVGDHEFVFTNAPTAYVWQVSDDGQRWRDLPETRSERDRRLFRIQRLRAPVRCRFLQLRIEAAEGRYPTLREVETYERPNARIAFPDWLVVVNTTHDPRLPNEGQQFIPLARSCAGWEGVQAQQVWLGDFNETFLAAEPRPLAGFLSGNFKDWCEINREGWRGTQEVLRHRNLPLWASCGGAQGLALLSEYGVDQPWDCPHCRDPLNPKTPIYTHVGHTGRKPCGDYSACESERGKFTMKQVRRDPAFAGLPREFEAMESHCGQIEWPPKGWDLVVTAGPGAKTRTQCLRLRDRYIYAAQFHIELPGTPGTSRQVMGNFLGLAKQWGGYQPRGKTVSPARPFEE